MSETLLEELEIDKKKKKNSRTSSFFVLGNTKLQQAYYACP